MAQQLLAYLSEDYSESNVDELRKLVQTLALSGTWSRSLPQWVDEVDDSSCTRPEDEPLRTVGVLLEVSEPGEVPATPVVDPTRVLEALAAFSAKYGVIFEVDFGQEVIGQIFNGIIDRSIREGLLDTW